VQSLQAQVEVSGKIVDSCGQPLSSIIVKDINATSKKMENYTETDTEGKFTIKADVGNILEIKALGYKKQEIIVQKDMGEQKIKLLDDAVTLNEITVKAKGVKIAGDTIKYLLSSYAKPEDRTLADVLSRVPGFEVDKTNGQISYDGKPISNFYIEGLDMLGQKYGTATNTLPQGDIATVEVMKHHQPIRVFDEFIYSDNDAINIRMKNGAKTHWISTSNGGIGLKNDGGLWSLENLSMRIKSNWQMMQTYKTNNIGKDISKETEKLFSFDEIDSRLTDFISLPISSTPLGQRSLFNRSHAVTLNMLRKIKDDSQMNLQVNYTNDRIESWGQQVTEYYKENNNRLIDNQKQFLEKKNNLYALLKYENNANNHYLKNTVSGDFMWKNQWLTETGTNPHSMESRVPYFTVKDNLYIIKKYGRHLISLHSNNVMQIRPQKLYVDSIFQDVNQHFYETNTDLEGNLIVGKFNLSAKVGVDAAKHNISSHLKNFSDSIGLLNGESNFSFVQLYASPEAEYKLSDFDFQLLAKMEYNHYKYTFSDAHSKYNFSPELHIRWSATPRWDFALHANILTAQVNVNQFYPTLILQDFEYINKGYNDYHVSRSKSAWFTVLYKNALKGTHFNITAKFSTEKDPYTLSREFTDKYVILSFLPEGTKTNSWNITTILSQGLGFLNGKFNAQILYNNTNSTIFQDGKFTPFKTYMLKTKAGLTLSFGKGIDFKYNLSYSLNKMNMPTLNSCSSLNSWKHDATIFIPLWKSFSMVTTLEYFHNQLTDKHFKDIFFADVSLKYTNKHFDYTLGINNMLNKKNYTYSINTNLVSNSTNNRVRGRELLFSVYYKP
jgi:hypothetical protein